jgi:AcrR family transcriptional regulator
MDKKQLILGTALQLFVENGFHGTATAIIAREAGVANGTLFNYFKTKEELIIALYHAVLNEMDVFIIEKMATHSISKDSFRSLFVTTVKWGIDNPTQYQYLQQFAHSPYYRNRNTSILNIEGNPLYVLIQNGIDVVIVKEMPVAFLYSLFDAQVKGLNSYLKCNDLEHKEQAVFIDEAFEMLWKMIKE